MTAALLGFDGAHFSTQKLQHEISQVFSIIEKGDADVLFVREDLSSTHNSLTKFTGQPIRVLFAAELRGANFDFFDFVIGWEDDIISPRYLRLPPTFRESWFFENCAPNQARFMDQEREFCNFIYSNSRAHPFRDQFFHALNHAKSVDSLGGHLNNRRIPDRIRDLGQPWGLEKISIQENYDFSIAIENGCYSGYSTEKIITACLAGSIPVYWGNPSVGKDFNPQRFISLHDFDTIDEAVRFILELSADRDRMNFIKAQPLFNQEQERRNKAFKQELSSFLDRIAQASLSSTLCRPVGTLTDESERLFREMASLQDLLEKTRHLATKFLTLLSPRGK